MSVRAAVDELSREAARRAAQQELSDPRYAEAQPPLLARVVGRVFTEVLELLDRAAANAPGGRAGVLLLLVLLIGFVAVVLTRLTPTRGGVRPSVFAGGTALSAADHRRRAELAADAGNWPEAIRERLRAAVRELEVRGILDSRPGRTAGEVARDASTVVPALAPVLLGATRVFDEVWYGGRTANRTSYDAVVVLDDAVTTGPLVLA